MYSLFSVVETVTTVCNTLCLSSPAHPAGCIKGTIYGLVNQYYARKSYRKYYIYFVGLLYHRLLQHGWELEYIRDIMLEATTKIESKGDPNQQPPSQVNGVSSTIFFST